MSMGQRISPVEATASLDTSTFNPSVALLPSEIMPLGILEVKGPDARSFLHGRVSSDVQSLAVGEGHPSALLDKGAHIQALMSIHCMDPERFWILCPFSQQETAQREILKYRIMEQLEVEVLTGQWTMALLTGAQWPVDVPSVLPLANPLTPIERLSLRTLRPNGVVSLELQEGKQGVLISAPYPVFGFWGEGFAFETAVALFLPNGLKDHSAFSQWRDALPQWSLEDYHRARIAIGHPAVGLEVLDTQTLLPEVGQAPATVSYTKGCFLGQETVARVKTYGSPPKAQVLVLLDAPNHIPNPIDDLTQGPVTLEIEGQPVGQLTSWVRLEGNKAMGLARMARAYRVPQGQYEGTLAGEKTTLTIGSLPHPLCPQVVALQVADQLFHQGSQKFMSGDEEGALQAFELAVTLNPRHLELMEAWGVLLGRLERFHEAIAVMETLLTLDPDSVMAHSNLSIFYLKLGDKDRAEEEKAKATVKGFQRQMRGQALGALKPLNAQEVERQEEGAQHPQEPQNALPSERLQLLEERIALFHNALQFAPEDVLTHYGLGTALSELGRYEEAVPALEKVVALQPSHSQAHLALGQALEAVGNLVEAKRIYAQGIVVASSRGDLMPLQSMEHRLKDLETRSA